MQTVNMNQALLQTLQHNGCFRMPWLAQSREADSAVWILLCWSTYITLPLSHSGSLSSVSSLSACLFLISLSPHQASHNYTVTQLFTSLLAGNHGELTSRPGTAPMAMSCSIQLFVFIHPLDLVKLYTHTHSHTRFLSLRGSIQLESSAARHDRQRRMGERKTERGKKELKI